MADYEKLETVGLLDLAGTEATITAVRQVTTKFGERFVVEMNSNGGEGAEAQTWVTTTGNRGDILRGIKATGKPTKVKFTAVETGQPKPFIQVDVV